MVLRAGVLLFLVISLWSFENYAASSQEGMQIVECNSQVFSDFKIHNYQDFSPIDCGLVQQKLEVAYLQVLNLSQVAMKAPQIVILNDKCATGGEYNWRTNVLSLRVTREEDSQKWLISAYHELGHCLFTYFIFKVHPAAFEIPGVSEFRRVLSGHNELFADLVVCLLFNDPDIVSRALATPAFNTDHLSFSKQTLLTPSSAVDDHSRLSSIRKNLWDQWVLPRMPQAAKLLEDLAVLFINDVFKNYQSDIELKFEERAIVEVERLNQLLELH